MHPSPKVPFVRGAESSHCGRAAQYSSTFKHRATILSFAASVLLLAIPAMAVVTAPNGTDTDPLNLTPEVQAAYQHFYDLDYANAEAAFEKIAAEHPDDPMAADYVLNNTVFRELYRLDLLDTTLYVEDGFLSGKHPVVEDPAVTARVEALYNHAVQLSNARLQANPNDVDALFARGYATSLETVYSGMVEKKYVPALRKALAARRDDDQVLKLDPKYVDCYLVVGVHEYVIGSLSRPYKILAGIVGIHGSKSKGMADLRRVGEDGIINSVAARTALAIFLRREAHYPQAIEVVDGLHRQYPHNFLFSLEQANLLKDSGLGMEAIAAYEALVKAAAAPGGYYPDPHVEMAYYGLGEAAHGQRNIAEAASAYENAAMQSTASPLLLRRAHLRAGEMYDLLGQRDQAKKQYDAVIALGIEFSQADAARKYERSPYTGK
jgi:tetratricopeptide (TPR) repeat protein